MNALHETSCMSLGIVGVCSFFLSPYSWRSLAIEQNVCLLIWIIIIRSPSLSLFVMNAEFRPGFQVHNSPPLDSSPYVSIPERCPYIRTRHGFYRTLMNPWRKTWIGYTIPLPFSSESVTFRYTGPSYKDNLAPMRFIWIIYSFS